MAWRKLGLERNMNSQGRGSCVGPKEGVHELLGRQEDESWEAIPICRLPLGWV